MTFFHNQPAVCELIVGTCVCVTCSGMVLSLMKRMLWYAEPKKSNQSYLQQHVVLKSILEWALTLLHFEFVRMQEDRRQLTIKELHLHYYFCIVKERTKNSTIHTIFCKMVKEKRKSELGPI